MDIRGLPGSTGADAGKFPYMDTFGFSMGGLISRTFQTKHGKVHNMVIVGTPNHGTHSIFEQLDELSTFPLVEIVKINSPGTADLFPYNDTVPYAWLSNNPRLYRLNLSPKCIPLADMTLIAGTKGVLEPPYLLGENDKIVPVDSVFCRTSKLSDGDASLLKVNSMKTKYEVEDEFDHLEFGDSTFRISENTKVKDAIIRGLSDWVVGRTLSANVIPFNDYYTIQFGEIEVEVQYNVMGRDIDRVALVIYGQDGSYKWHVFGTYADATGKITYSEPIAGNSAGRNPALKLYTNHLFQESQGIWNVVFELIPLKPGQETVALEPSANFELPQ
jgi:hypothetical protein